MLPPPNNNCSIIHEINSLLFVSPNDLSRKSGQKSDVFLAPLVAPDMEQVLNNCYWMNEVGGYLLWSRRAEEESQGGDITLEPSYGGES